MIYASKNVNIYVGDILSKKYIVKGYKTNN